MIDELLFKRGARRLSPTATEEGIRSRQEVTRAIADHYAEFYELRRAINGSNPVKLHQVSPHLIVSLLCHEVLTRSTTEPSGYEIKPAFRSYFNGGWLEELAYLAMEEAGVEELYCGQRIIWSTATRKGECEVDLISRRGEELSFVSCKALRPWFRDAQREQLLNFLGETDYWDHHFAGGKGRAMLLVSTDLIDELNRNAERFPQLLNRAEIIDVDVVSLDFFNWPTLVKRFHDHWA